MRLPDKPTTEEQIRKGERANVIIAVVISCLFGFGYLLWGHCHS